MQGRHADRYLQLKQLLILAQNIPTSHLAVKPVAMQSLGKRANFSPAALRFNGHTKGVASTGRPSSLLVVAISNVKLP
jgi:hypothetical protein